MSPDIAGPTDPGRVPPSRTTSGVVGGWAIALGTLAAVWGAGFQTFGRLLGLMLAPLLRAANVSPMQLVAVVEIALTVATVVTGVIAWRKGARSWTFFAACILGIVIGGAWTAFAVAEVLVPHG
jgi:hypothetical protein